MKYRLMDLLLALALGITVFAGGLTGPASVTADTAGLLSGEEKPVSEQSPDVKQPENAGAPGEIAVLETSAGRIVLRFFPDSAPNHVDNFKKLARDKFYDGTKFHRVIEGFMIQGGCPLGTGTGGSGKNIKGEFASNGVNNPLKHTRGVISMARSMMPNSASSQFFIMHKNAPHLDGQYAAFGKVTEGMDVVDQIAACETDASDKPLESVVIEKAWIE